MYIKKILVFLLILLAFSCAVDARNFEKLTLIDGSILEGYISEQVPGESYVFSTHRALLVINKEDLSQKLSNFKYVDIKSDLSKEWQDWFKNKNKQRKNNDKAENDDKKVNLFKSVFLRKDANKANYLQPLLTDLVDTVESDESDYKFRVIFDKNVKCVIPVSDVVKITRTPAKNSVMDVIVLNDKRKKSGWIVEQIPGESVTLAIKNSSSRKKIEFDQILCFQKTGFLPDSEKELIKQTPVLDLVLVKQSSQQADNHLGLIVYQDFGDNDDSSAIIKVYDFSTKETFKIPFDDVEKIIKLSNPLYEPAN